MNKTNKQFYKDVYNLFPKHKQKERNYLNKLKKQIDECEIDSYEQLEKLFGTPIDIVKAYYDTVDSQYLIKAMQMKKIIRSTCVTLITFVLFISLWIIHIYNQAYEDFQTAVPDNYYEVIEEVD